MQQENIRVIDADILRTDIKDKDMVLIVEKILKKYHKYYT